MSDTTFAARLVAARTAAGMPKQAQLLAKLDGSAQSSLSSWETGKREPSVEDIRKLAKACSCSADYLLGLTDVIHGSLAGHWVVDDDRVDMVRAKKVPPDRGRYAWPLPLHFRVMSSTDLQQLEDGLLGKRKGESK
jgi:transcriptional regulator with XRE-family HTH domain